jgi:hypothetical protein
MWQRFLGWWVCILGVLSFVIGCGTRDPQITLEHRLAYGISVSLKGYEFDHPGIPVTNLAQIYEGWNRGYPYGLHQRFKKFGKYAGFKDSIYEKYIFPVGLSNRIDREEILFLNAQPFPDRDGKLGRIVISKVGDGQENHRLKWTEEQRIQQIFQEAGIPEPKPVPMPLPPPAPPGREGMQAPLWWEMQFEIMDFCKWLGLPSQWAVWIQWALVISLVGLLGMCIVWIWRHFRRVD